MKKLEDDRAYDPADWTAAMGKSLLCGEEIPIGKFLERTDVPTLRGPEPVLNAGPSHRLTHGSQWTLPRAFVEELV